LFETLYGLQRILKDLHRRLRCAQLLWTRFVTRKFRVNVLDAEELVIGQGQQSLEFFRGQLDCYFGHVNTILPHFRYAVIHPEHAARLLGRRAAQAR